MHKLSLLHQNAEVYGPAYTVGRSIDGFLFCMPDWQMSRALVPSSVYKRQALPRAFKQMCPHLCLAALA